MRKSVWRPLVIALALALALASVVVYADKPTCGGNHCDHGTEEDPVLSCAPGKNNIEICASKFKFVPNPFNGGGIVDWFNKEGTHNVSICNVDTADASGICARGDVINGNGKNGEDFGEGEMVTFDFDTVPAFAGKTVNYFCRFHGKSKGMVGTVNVPGL